MNIIIYTHLYPTPEKYGIPPDTKVVHYFARDWQKMGHRVQVIVMNHWPVKELGRHPLSQIIPREDDYEWEGVPVHIFNYQLLTPKKRHPEAFQARKINDMLSRFKKRLGWTADRVFVNFPTFCVGITEIFTEDVPSIGVFHISDQFNLELDSGNQVREFLGRFTHWGYRNKQIGQYIHQHLGREAVPVYSGIDERLIAPEAVIKRKSQRQDEPLRLIYAGTLMARKRADDLIRAIKKIDFPCTLTIVGDGPERAAFEAEAAGDSRVVFRGRLSRDETVAAMQEADAFLMVSTQETFGLVYLEAMGQGCITVASRGEGIDGILTDGENGFLVAPGDVDGIAQIIHRIRYLTPEEKAKLLESGYALAQNMTSMKTSQRYLDANQ